MKKSTKAQREAEIGLANLLTENTFSLPPEKRKEVESELDKRLKGRGASSKKRARLQAASRP